MTALTGTREIGGRNWIRTTLKPAAQKALFYAAEDFCISTTIRRIVQGYQSCLLESVCSVSLTSQSTFWNKLDPSCVCATLSDAYCLYQQMKQSGWSWHVYLDIPSGSFTAMYATE